MRLLTTTLMVLIATVICAQNSQLASIYNQLPQVPDKCLCKSPKYYTEEMALLESLANQLREIKNQLEGELQNEGDDTYNTISAVFPTAEELATVDKLPEAEQRAFWKKIEDDNTRIEKAIASNSTKYRVEKEALNKKVADYQNQLLPIVEEYSLADYKAGEVKSNKRQKIYNTCIENNTLTMQGKQQIEDICVEFCSVVSPALLTKLRFEYSHLKQNIALYRRLTLIDIAESSMLPEEVVREQKSALLDLTDLEMILQYITSYTSLYDILPGGISNQK